MNDSFKNNISFLEGLAQKKIICLENLCESFNLMLMSIEKDDIEVIENCGIQHSNCITNIDEIDTQIIQMLQNFDKPEHEILQDILENKRFENNLPHWATNINSIMKAQNDLLVKTIDLNNKCIKSTQEYLISTKNEIRKNNQSKKISDNYSTSNGLQTGVLLAIKYN